MRMAGTFAVIGAVLSVSSAGMAQDPDPRIARAASAAAQARPVPAMLPGPAIRSEPVRPPGSGTKLLRAWDMGQGVELGLGRFGVGEIAQRMHHTERLRAPLDMRGRNRGIAGMGLRLQF